MSIQNFGNCIPLKTSTILSIFVLGCSLSVSFDVSIVAQFTNNVNNTTHNILFIIIFYLRLSISSGVGLLGTIINFSFGFFIPKNFKNFLVSFLAHLSK